MKDGFAEQSYLFPGPEDSKPCHTEAAGRVLGLQTAQINRLRDYEGTLDHQLRALNHISVLNKDIGEQYGDFPRWHNPFDEAAPIELRARSYLAANCASRLKRSGSSPSSVWSAV